MADFREIFLGDEMEEELARHIESELLIHYEERGQHIEDLLRWQKDYWAKPTKEKATFPFSGAATIVIPLGAIAVETIHARVMTTFFGLDQFITAKAVAPEWQAVSKPIERFMDRELLVNMKFRRSLGDCFLEAEKFGTGIGKSGYESHVRTVIREIGGIEEEVDIVTKQGACFDPVADSRFLMPFSNQDPQFATWVGEEHSSSPYELEMMEAGGMIRKGTIIREDDEEPSKLETWARTQSDRLGQADGAKFDDAQADLEHTRPSYPNQIDWVELWMAWDTDKSGRKKEIVVKYHRGSHQFLSIRYNWHHDLRRPYRMVPYMTVEHRGRGIGLCKMNEQFQRELTTQHRQRLDNATLANLRMFKINKLSGYGSKEPVFPGKLWFLDDMDHLDSVQMGEIYPSSFSNEQATLLYFQQRTGVNDSVLGMPQAGTPGTATSDLARIKESNKKFDFIFANFKEFTNEVISDVLCNIQQFGPKRVEYIDNAEGGDLVRQFFQMPETLVRDGVLLSIRTVGEQTNEIIDRQNWQQVAAFLQQYYQSIIQLAMPMGDPNLIMTIFQRGLSSATEAMRQILETYNIRNIDRLIVKELDFGSVGIGIQPGGNQGVTGNDPNAIRAALAAAFSQNGNGSNGVPGGIY